MARKEKKTLNGDESEANNNAAIVEQEIKNEPRKTRATAAAKTSKEISEAVAAKEVSDSAKEEEKETKKRSRGGKVVKQNKDDEEQEKEKTIESQDKVKQNEGEQELQKKKKKKTEKINKNDENETNMDVEHSQDKHSSTASNTATATENVLEHEEEVDNENAEVEMSKERKKGEKGIKLDRKMKVHRCRFLDFKPDPIHAIAASTKRPVVAVGRSHGDIEIWKISMNKNGNSNGRLGWNLETTIPSPVNTNDNYLRSLSWGMKYNDDIDHQDRLFGATLKGEVFEVDFVHGCVRPAASNGGSVWSLSISPISGLIAAACEDGKIHIFEPSEKSSKNIVNPPTHIQTLISATSLGRITAVTWSKVSEHTLYSSHNDGNIRVWDRNTAIVEGRAQMGKVTHVMNASSGSVRKSDGEKSSATSSRNIIWALVATADNQLISADSSGVLNVWNCNQGVLFQRFTEHRADIFSLALGMNDSTLFASGFDNRVAMFERNADKQSWSYVYSHRPHTHDVRGLAIVNLPSMIAEAKQSIVVSGGTDTQIAYYDVNSFAKCRPKKIPPAFQGVISNQSRTFLVQQPRWVEVWSVPNESNESVKHLSTIKLKGNPGIKYSAISPSWVVCGSDSNIRTYRLNSELALEKPTVAVVKDAQKVAITGDSLLLVGINPFMIKLINLETFKPAGELSSHDIPKDSNLSLLSVHGSEDGQWASTLDNAGTIRVFMMDTGKIHCTLECDASHMHFTKSGNEIIYCTIDGTVSMYSIDSKQVTELNRTKLPKGLVVKGLSYTSTIKGKNRFMTWGDTWLRIGGKKECEEKYSPIAFTGYCGDGEAIVVEAPWLKIMKNFPEALDQDRFGT